MTKKDRAKMERRIESRFDRGQLVSDGVSTALAEICRIIEHEVDRAMRAERKSQRIAIEELNKWHKEAQERAVRMAISDRYDEMKPR